MDVRGRWALVTGASSGLGADFARDLAARGCSVVVVARRRERLEELATELRAAHGVEIDVEPQDLALPDAAADLHERVTGRGREIDILVNNAGFSVHGPFLERERERMREMVQVNVVALLELTHLFGSDMAARGRGWIAEVSSVAGLVPTPSMSAYSATKAFVAHMTYGLGWELQAKGVRIIAICPGATETEFFEVAGQKPTWYTRLSGMKSADVARIGVRAMLANRSRVIPGWRNWFTVMAVRPLPFRFVGWCVWQLMGRTRR